MKLRFTLITAIATFAFLLAACGAAETEIVEVIKEVVVEKEVIKTVEVPGETVVVEKEVIKTVEVPGETVIKEVTKIVEVPVEVTVEKEVTKVVEVPVEVIVTKEVIKIVEVEVAFAGFSEAPALAQLVAAGKLPPVAERLPDQPMVMPMLGTIGQYGGTLRRFYLGPSDACNFFRVSRASFARYSTDGFSVLPSLAKGWSASKDGKVWTIFMREGLKWSDGEDFNMDDVMFQYEQVIKNEDLNPGGRLVPFLRIGRDPATEQSYLGTLEKIDDYSFKITYPVPNFLFTDTLAQTDENCGRVFRDVFWNPEHYMKQFHGDFNPNADADAKAAGFDSWMKWYDRMAAYISNPEKPNLAPWKYNNPLGDSLVTADRNPYYWAVDPDGKQLPYIDTVTLTLVDNPTVGTLKAVQGEIDFQGRHIRLPDFTVLKEGEEKGGYRIVLWPGFGGTDAELHMNHSFVGPTGDAIRNLEFRRALSVAIDREAINEVNFLGLGTIRNSVPVPGHAQYPGVEYEKANTQYDPAMAMEILDKIYPDKDSDGWRLTGPGGERIDMIIANAAIFLAYPDITEQVVANWRAVGVFADSETMTRSLAFTRVRNNEFPVWIFDQGSGFGYQSAAGGPGGRSNPGWSIYIRTDGAEGVEPTQEALDDSAIKSQAATLPDAERNEVGKAYFRSLIDRVWDIGLIGMSPASQGVNIVNIRLQNVPETNVANIWAFRTPNGAYPEQWWYK